MSPIEPGDPTPPLALLNQEGEPVDLADLRDRWVLLFWFPKADTPGCTAQAQGLRDQQPAFDDLDCVVLGASFDEVDALSRFHAKYGLTFDVLSDSTRAAGQAFGVAGPEGEAAYATRTSFLVGPGGTVRKVYDVEDPALHAEHVLDDLEALTT